MRIYTKSGDLAFSTLTFPDGQPHFRLETVDDSGFNAATIEVSIKSPTDLFMVQLVALVLRNVGFSQLVLDVRYLMGARMDRAISGLEPHTLQLVSQVINSCGFSKVRILDAHSEVATRLIRNSVNLLPYKVVEQVITTCSPDYVVVPDKGAVERTTALRAGKRLIFCAKKRDMATGALTGFEVDKSEGIGRCYDPFTCLIIDDICDGGGTFVGLAKELRKKGAKKVFLFVTHGIMSKGWPLEGIDKIYTTDSIFPNANVDGSALVVVPISMETL